MKTLLFIIVDLLLTVISCSAYTIRHISNKDGLSNSAILSIHQDREGLMWFGSCDGLNMFDGSNIRVYHSSGDKNNLSGNLIKDILETDEGIFWLQTNYGLNKLDKRRKAVDYFLDFNGYMLMEKDKENVLFILKDNGCVYYYSKKANNILKIALPELIMNDVLDFTIDQNNIFWIFKKEGSIVRYSIVKDSKEGISLALLNTSKHSDRLLYCFHEENAVYYIDGTSTLFEYNLLENNKNYIGNLQNVMLKKGEVSAIIKSQNNYFIGFKTNGLICLKNTPENAEKYRMEDIDIKSGVFCLYKDNFQDVIWVGTDGQGVYFCFDYAYSIQSTNFDNIPHEIEKPVRSLFLDKENTLWIGTKGDGILKLYNYNSNANIAAGKMDWVTTENSNLSDNFVYALAAGSRNILWIGNDEGLNYYSYTDRKIKKVELTNKGIPIKYIHSICEINDSVLWLASVGMGIIKAKISGKDHPVLTNIEQFTTQKGGLAGNYFFTVYAENNDNIWFGNRGYGIFKFDFDSLKLKPVYYEESYHNQLQNDVFSIVKDEQHNLWCGTSLGLVKYTPDGKHAVFNEKSGFPNNTVHGILKDSQDKLWLSTNRGIVRFDIEKETFQIYGRNYGLNVTEFSDGAFFKDEKTGNLFFGGIDGFVVIDALHAKPIEYTPPVYFTSLSIFGSEYNLVDFYSSRADKNELVLNYDQNFFSISFSVSDYINGNNYSYFYKLNELSEWVDNKESKTISFTNMAPGKYTLLVKYLNGLTGKESSVYSIVLHIRPPWYLSVFAYFIYIVLALAGIISLFFYYIRKKKIKQLAELEKIEQKHHEEIHESKLRFFTNIAHEFCTPLTLIYAPCDRILAHKGSDKFVIEYTTLIRRNAERLNSLIQELIEFRRIETGNRIPYFEQLSITGMVSDIIDSFEESIALKDIAFRNTVQKSLVWNTDKTFLYTVITNLISNALKYTNKNGTIKVIVKEDAGNLRITISNTGKGIKKENFDRIFDRYSILDDFENQDEETSVSRNGLGLAISNNLVKLLGGKIEIESIPNEITSFTILLPPHAVSPSANGNLTLPEITIRKEYNETMELPKYKFDRTKQTVLVIDDDIEIVWLICEMFTGTYNVIPVNKVRDVKDILNDTRPDIIICDVMMPEMDGITLVKQFKADKTTAHIPVILISAKHSIEEQIEGLDAGAEMYITKPFNIDYLKISVKQLISRKETLKDYFKSPISAFDLLEGKLTHKEDKQFLQNVLNVINNHLMEKDLSTQFIADKLNISVRKLFRKTTEICNQSASDMIKECRLHVSQHLLLNTKMNIDEIAYNSGFQNRATFYNDFSKKFNCTPKEFRDKPVRGMK